MGFASRLSSVQVARRLQDGKIAKAKGAKSRTVLVCWMLWCERNRRIFEGVERCPDQITAMIQADAWQRILAGATKLRCIVAHRFSE
jgi:hypothetical protein